MSSNPVRMFHGFRVITVNEKTGTSKPFGVNFSTSCSLLAAVVIMRFFSWRTREANCIITLIAVPRIQPSKRSVGKFVCLLSWLVFVCGLSRESSGPFSPYFARAGYHSPGLCSEFAPFFRYEQCLKVFKRKKNPTRG